MFRQANRSFSFSGATVPVLVFLALTLFFGLFDLPAQPADSSTIRRSDIQSNNVVRDNSARSPAPSIRARTKAGILAGSSLAALSLLALAAGLALLHAFKQR
jgi:hypothetical protein